MPARAIVIESISVEAIGECARADQLPQPIAARAGGLQALAVQQVYFSGALRATPFYASSALAQADVIVGPAVLCDPTQPSSSSQNGRSRSLPAGGCFWRAISRSVREHAIGTQADPVLLEVFNNLSMSVAEQMGVTLANTSYSVNIKERLDFSCALFDGRGSLIANAPHMPVHLGSMGEAVATILKRREGQMRGSLAMRTR